MYLCCVEILSGFRSKLDFLRIFKVTQKSAPILQSYRSNKSLKIYLISIERERVREQIFIKSIDTSAAYAQLKVLGVRPSR